jgi:hypothetical protein
MHRCVLMAAMTVLAGSVCAVAPGWAQDISVSDSFTPSHSTDGQSKYGSPLAYHSFGEDRFSLFSNRKEFGGTSYAFESSVDGYYSSGRYSRIPTYNLLSGSSITDEAFVLRDVFASVSLLPGLQLDVARWNNPVGSESLDRRASGLFDNPVIAGTGMNSPHVALGNSGSYFGAQMGITDEISLHFGRTSSSLGGTFDVATPIPSDVALQLSSQAAMIETASAGLNWNVTDWAEVGVSASRASEAASLLVNEMSMPITNSAGVETVALGISARVGFGEGWVTTVAYTEGITQLNLNTSTVNFGEPVRSRSYGFSLAKQGILGNDALGIAVTQPLQTFGGTNFVNLSLENVLNNRARFESVPQSDFTVGYVTTFLDGALALQANAAYQVNANGEQGQDAVSVLSRAQIKF